MSKTEENLKFAFAGESQARNKYTFFAEVARNEGFEQIAAIFEETAANEKAHAERLFNFLKSISDTKQNLKTAIEGEHYEWTEMYPTMAKEAREEGFNDIAAMFEGIAKVEKEHEERYKKLLANIENGTVFVKDGKFYWKCLNCGHIHEGINAPNTCPVCKHPQAYFEIHCGNY